MEIWLRNDAYNVRFPVLPAEYTISSSSNNTSVHVTALSEVTLLGDRNLQEISFETFIPKIYDATFCDCVPQYSPTEFASILEQMKRSGVCRLTMSGVFAGQVTIETLDTNENDGTGDVNISLSLKEYIKPVVTKVSTRVISETRTAKAGAGASKTYTAKSGDNLSKIAQSQTGKAGNWRTIYSDNQGTIGSNPNLIKPGQQLKIRASY